jgi:hypothetical protein
MANTRTVISPGVFANSALTSIPPTPVKGVAYRNAAVPVGTVNAGWAYDNPVESASSNEILYRMSGLLDIMDRQGLLGWTNLINYAVGAFVLGSNGIMYRSILASGPSTAPQDPISAATYWRPVVDPATSAEMAAGTATDRVATPANIATMFTGAGRRLVSANGYQYLPGDGTSKPTIMQWALGNITGPGVATITWPVPFNNSVFTVQATVDQPTTVPPYVTALSLTGCSVDLSAGSEGANVYVFAIGV